MFEDQHSSASARGAPARRSRHQNHHHSHHQQPVLVEPPLAHAASAAPFRPPLDLAALTSAASIDLHAALSAIPNSRHQTTASNSSSSAAAAASFSLQQITQPPAVPPQNTKFWDTPPPQLATLKPTPPQQLPAAAATLQHATPTAHSSASASPSPPPSLPPLSLSGATSTVPCISSLSAASASPSQADAAWNTNQTAQLVASASAPGSKYTQLLAVLEEMAKDVRPSYAGSKSSAERLKRAITHARILVREALVEVEKASK